MLYLFYDTETTGKWHKDLPLDHDAQPNLVQLASIITDSDRKILQYFVVIVRPNGWTIPAEVSQIHGISDHRARSMGIPLMTAIALFSAFCVTAGVIVGHNLAFDINIMLRSYWQMNKEDRIPDSKVCTMLMAKDILKLPSSFKSKSSKDPYKWPSLQETYTYFHKTEFKGAHSALEDTRATMDCYWEMRDLGVENVAPYISFQPISQASPGSKLGETRTLEFLKTTIEKCRDKPLNDWERTFVSDMASRIEEQGDRIMISSKQWAILEKLRDMYLKDKTPDMMVS